MPATGRNSIKSFLYGIASQFIFILALIYAKNSPFHWPEIDKTENYVYMNGYSIQCRLKLNLGVMRNEDIRINACMQSLSSTLKNSH